MPEQISASPLEQARAAPTVLERDYLVLGLLATLCALVGLFVLQDPPRIDRLTVVNPSAYDVSARARSSDETAVTSVGTIRAGSNRDFDRVIDQGGTWVFELSSQGRDGSELVVTREELAEADWTLTISDAVVSALEAQGATPPR